MTGAAAIPNYVNDISEVYRRDGLGEGDDRAIFHSVNPISP